MPTPRHRAPTPRTTAPRRRAPPRSRCSLGARAQLPRHGTPRHLGKARPHLRPKLVVAPQDELRLRRRPGAQRAHAPAVGGAAAACGGALASCGAGRRAVARAAERVRACERKCMFIVSHSGDGELLSQSPCPDPPDSSSDLYTPRTSECSSPMWQTLCPPSPPPRALLMKVDEELPFADQSSSLSFRRAEDSSVCPTSCTVRLRSTASPLQDGTCVSTPLTSLPTRPAARPSRPATAQQLRRRRRRRVAPGIGVGRWRTLYTVWQRAPRILRPLPGATAAAKVPAPTPPASAPPALSTEPAHLKGGVPPPVAFAFSRAAASNRGAAMLPCGPHNRHQAQSAQARRSPPRAFHHLIPKTMAAPEVRLGQVGQTLRTLNLRASPPRPSSLNTAAYCFTRFNRAAASAMLCSAGTKSCEFASAITQSAGRRVPSVPNAKPDEGVTNVAQGAATAHSCIPARPIKPRTVRRPRVLPNQRHFHT